MTRAGVRATGMHRGKDLIRPPALPARPAPAAEPAVVSPWAQASIDDILEQVRRLSSPGADGRRTARAVAGARMILDHLAALPGESWLDRWSLFDAATTQGAWQDAICPDRGEVDDVRLTVGLGRLLVLDVIRPSFAWQHRRHIFAYTTLGRYRDAEGFALVTAKAEELLGTRTVIKVALLSLGKIQASTGKTVRQVNANDLLTADTALAELGVGSVQRRALEHLWRVLTELGWLQHESVVWPFSRTRTAKLSPEQLVDLHKIDSPHREVFTST